MLSERVVVLQLKMTHQLRNLFAQCAKLGLKHWGIVASALFIDPNQLPVSVAISDPSFFHLFQNQNWGICPNLNLKAVKGFVCPLKFLFCQLPMVHILRVENLQSNFFTRHHFWMRGNALFIKHVCHSDSSALALMSVAHWLHTSVCWCFVASTTFVQPVMLKTKLPLCF